MTRVHVFDLVADLRAVQSFERRVEREQTGTEQAADIYLEWLKQRYLNAGNGSWPPLESETLKRKAKIGASDDILIEFGDLYANLTKWREGTAWVVGYQEGIKHTSLTEKYAFSGTVAQLAEIQSTGAYKGGKRRPIIVAPDSATFNRMREIIKRGLSVVIAQSNRETRGR